MIRRVFTANHVVDEQTISEETEFTQMDLFTDYQAVAAEQKAGQEKREKSEGCRRQCFRLRKIWEECSVKGNEPSGGGDHAGAEIIRLEVIMHKKI